MAEESHFDQHMVFLDNLHVLAVLKTIFQPLKSSRVERFWPKILITSWFDQLYLWQLSSLEVDFDMLVGHPYVVDDRASPELFWIKSAYRLLQRDRQLGVVYPD